MRKRQFNLWHPTKGRLRHWLETGQPDSVGDHVEQCDRCADLLVNLEPVFQLDEPTSFRNALASALNPPDDLPQRVMLGIEERAKADRELALFAGLFTIGLDTAKLMVADEPDIALPRRHDVSTEPDRTEPDRTDSDRGDTST